MILVSWRKLLSLSMRHLDEPKGRSWSCGASPASTWGWGWGRGSKEPRVRSQHVGGLCSLPGELCVWGCVCVVCVRMCVVCEGVRACVLCEGMCVVCEGVYVVCVCMCSMCV